MINKVKAIVPAEYEGRQIKDFAKKAMQLSSTRLKKAKHIKDGILQNGKSVYVTSILHEGDEVMIVLEEEDAVSETIVPVEGELNVIFRDEYLTVLDKPPKMPVHPNVWHPEDSLANRYVASFGGVFRPVNRLDAGTSGLMVVAGNPQIHTLLSKQLHTDEFRREYLAVTEGIPKEREGTIDLPIGRAEGSCIKRRIEENGQWAVTNYRVEDWGDGYALVKLNLLTGRTHQIRVHLAAIGCPLAGDFLYGREDHDLIPRPALHSHKINLLHPVTGERMEFSSELPQDMKKLLERMKENVDRNGREHDE